MKQQTTGNYLASACVCLAIFAAVAMQQTQQVHASQGCPFKDESCEEYCKQQGCNLGYCGHFAWIQCICRKCGQEWEWYDKVRLSDGKAVNQTELDSLKLNTTETQQQKQQQTNLNSQNDNKSKSKTVVVVVPISASLPSSASARQQPPQQHQQQTDGNDATQQSKAEKEHASLASMLIPDLTDQSKIGAEFEGDEVPDESSEKFLDFLAKNHEKLAAATGANTLQQTPATAAASVQTLIRKPTSDTTTTTATSGSVDDDVGDDDDEEGGAIEIQIKTISSPNATQEEVQQMMASTSSTTTPSPPPSSKSSTSPTLTLATQSPPRASQENESGGEQTILDKLIRSAAFLD